MRRIRAVRRPASDGPAPARSRNRAATTACRCAGRSCLWNRFPDLYIMPRPPLRPAAAGARRRRPHAAGRAGQRHGADGSGILRRGALLRQFAGRTARLRHAQGTRIVAARLSGRALHHPALHRRTRDRGSRIGRHMALSCTTSRMRPSASGAGGSGSQGRANICGSSFRQTVYRVTGGMPSGFSRMRTESAKKSSSVYPGASPLLPASARPGIPAIPSKLRSCSWW